MRELPLTWLRALAAVHDAGGVRPAARRLGVAHSAVSRQLRELEAWLGPPLVERGDGPGRVRLTAEGEALGRAALRALGDLEAAVEAAREARRAGAVVLATTPSFAARWLLPRLGAFEAAHPRVQLSIVVDRARKAPPAAGADLAVVMSPRPPEEGRAEPLMDDALHPVMSPALWRGAEAPEGADGLAALLDLRLLHDRDPSAAWTVWRDARGPRALETRRGPRLTSADLVLRAAERGLGVALARERLAADALAAGALVAPWRNLAVPLPRTHWLVLSDEAPPRAAVRAVADWLRAEAADGAASDGVAPRV